MTLFGDLHDLMKPPALYERTDAAFWDDEHISRGMLAAHLDPEFEGASRSFAFMDRSVDWICATAPPATHPRLLDLGCGPGLYAERSANEQGLAIDYRCRNYLELDLDGSFDIAVMIYCDYGALSSDERRVVLRRVRERLRPGGALALDVFSRRKLEAFEERTTWEEHPAGGFWNAGPHFEVQRCRRFSECVSLEQIAVIASEGATSYHLWNTYFTPATLSAELEEAGFEAVELVGDAAGAPFDDASLTICAVSRKSAIGKEGR